MKRNDKHNFTLATGTVAALAPALPLVMVSPAVSAADISTTPPVSFKKVSSLVKLPDSCQDWERFTQAIPAWKSRTITSFSGSSVLPPLKQR